MRGLCACACGPGLTTHECGVFVARGPTIPGLSQRLCVCALTGLAGVAALREGALPALKAQVS